MTKMPLTPSAGVGRKPAFMLGVVCLAMGLSVAFATLATWMPSSRIAWIAGSPRPRSGR